MIRFVPIPSPMTPPSPTICLPSTKFGRAGARWQTASSGRMLPYAIAQISGAFVGACLVWLHFMPHWKVTPDAESKRAVFCTIPAIRNLPANVISEIIGTAVLVLVAGAISSKLAFATGTAPGFSPLPRSLPCLEHRPFTRRDNGIRHQSGARSWSSYCPRCSSHLG